MVNFLKVQGHETLVRDTRSRAIINTSRQDYINYKKAEEIAMQKQSSINKHDEEIDGLKTEIAEIKSLLKQLLEK